jgi:hypothetical protein
MKTPPPLAEPEWLGETLNEYFASPPAASPLWQNPSPEFLERCRTAGSRALDLARMRRQRSKLAAVLTPLAEHFRGLAQLAGVRIDGVFASLGIARAEAPDRTSAARLGRLAQALGLSGGETELRLRLGFAMGSRSPASAWLAAELFPAVARRGGESSAPRLEARLRECEAGYSAARGTRLRHARAAVAAAFAAEDDAPRLAEGSRA